MLISADTQIVQEKQVRVRRSLISEGFEALDDGDKLTQIIEHTNKIFQRQLEKVRLVHCYFLDFRILLKILQARSDLLACTSVIAVPDRFANYAESLSVALYFATEQERHIVEECRQKAKQSHEEFTRHAGGHSSFFYNPRKKLFFKKIELSHIMHYFQKIYLCNDV